MRITLATPPFYTDNPHEPITLPLGIAYLAGMLEQHGFKVSVVDGAVLGGMKRLHGRKYLAGGTPALTAKTIYQTHPDLIGFSCPFTPRYRLFSECIREYRQIAPSVPIIAGGIHPTLLFSDVLDKNDIQGIVLGEGEESFLQVALRYRDHGKIDLEGIDGVAWKENDALRHNPKTSYIQDLDSLPMPARHLFDMDLYLEKSGGWWAGQRERIMAVMTSRSCPGRCSFCSIHAVMGPKWRPHSPERVITELQQTVETWHPTLIAFVDDRLTWNRERMVDICRGMIESDISLPWYTPNGVHVEDLDQDLLKLMKKAGCRSLNLAIESGDPHILRRVIGKKGTPEQASKVARVCRELKIHTNAYFVLGMPGETDETIHRSLDLALSLPLDGLGVFIATPFPGTRMYRQCVREGYIDEMIFAKEYLEAGDPDLLHRPLFDTETMSRERLLWWEKEFKRQFFRKYYREHPLQGLKSIARRIVRRVVK